MKNISILGSTGSVGLSTLAIVRNHPERFRVRALAAKKNAAALLKQAREFKPELVCLYDAGLAAGLAGQLKPLKVRVVHGDEGLLEAGTLASADQVVFAMVGAAGLAPIFAAICAGKSIAIANKEPLVMAGALLMREAKKRGVQVRPVDSEHSGIWQCLEGRRPGTIKRLILTSSGGPFRKWKGALSRITPRAALKHPKWKMGPKITIDSATLMNKGLEVIEAANLFGFPVDQIGVLIHPEAIIHALIELADGSMIAQLGITDMRLPIQYAMSFPERLNNHLPAVDLVRIGCFHFEEPDRRRFPCLDLGYEASRAGGSMPAVLNAANEVAVAAFLERRIAFTAIPKIIASVMNKHRIIRDPGLEDILEADRRARVQAEELL